MDVGEKELEKKISISELEDEELTHELSKAQKKAAIREAKALYGTDWKKTIWGAVKGMRVDRETLQTLHGMGVDTSLRDFNDPSKMKR